MKTIKTGSLLFSSLWLIMLFSGCRKEIDNFKKIDPGTSGSYPLNGEYFVRLDQAVITGTDTTWTLDLLGGYVKIMLFNTATDRNDSVWIDDLQNIFPFKVKATCNPAQRIFSVTGARELYQDSIVSLSKGKLLLKLGKSKAGNITDSIHMYVKYGTDPSLYRLSGVRRTGFREDEP